MKSGVLKLSIVVIGLSLFFTYIGVYFLPQSESHPPKVIKVEKGISQEELITIGEDIVFGKGQCMVCHPMKAETGMRSPAISTIGAEIERIAKKRGMTPEEHLFESLVNPSSFVAEGYDDIMPPLHESPVSLTEGELIAVAAFLQSQGGRVTVSYPESVSLLRIQIEKAGGDEL
jgi:hypothetical protein